MQRLPQLEHPRRRRRWRAPALPRAAPMLHGRQRRRVGEQGRVGHGRGRRRRAGLGGRPGGDRVCVGGVGGAAGGGEGRGGRGGGARGGGCQARPRHLLLEAPYLLVWDGLGLRGLGLGFGVWGLHQQ